MSYVELHCHSAYSFGDGASLPEELAAAAAMRGYEALAITDHDGVWGAMELAHACEPLGVRPIVGAELTVYARSRGGALGLNAGDPHLPGAAPKLSQGERPNCPPGCFHLTLLVEDARGWRNLCRLITEAHRHTRPKPQNPLTPPPPSERSERCEGEARVVRGRLEPLPPAVALEEVEQRAEGLVCLSGCARDGALAGRWERGDPGGAEALGRRLVAAFGRERFRVELQRPFWRRDRARNRWLDGLAERLGVRCVATGNVHMHDHSRAALQDVLVAARLGLTLEESEPRRRGNPSSALAAPGEMARRFEGHPDAVAETVRLAERLRFDVRRELGYRYPGAEDPDADHTLAEICQGRLEHRYKGTCDHREAVRRLEEELRVIRSLGLSGFFLLHYDMLELAREVAAEARGADSARMLLPPGRGRGSSVSSVVCYLTGLSHIDPVRNGLFLGRFLNDEIAEVPDIDLDFPRDIREKLIPRVHERYGPERSALVAAFACYRSRGAVRDFGKALGLPAGEIERVARMVDLYDRRENVERDMAEAIGEPRAGSVRWRALAGLARESWGLPRHASQHPGGMVLSTRPLVDICPVQPAAMEGRQLVQWDKDSCADAGFLKIDLLGLGMLSAVERCVDEIARVRGERIDLSRVPLDDRDVYETIQRADTTGVFQIESRAQMQMLPRSRPESLEDLTVQVALVRPGPIQGGAVHPYLERRERLREDPAYEVPYDHPSLEPVLSDTLGTIVFQEQVIQVAMALAGFSPGEAEGLRRAMSRKRSEEALLAYRERFLEGAVERGVTQPVAESMFEQIRGFSGFGFPKAHAAAFGLLAYQSTWLRVHYGPEFLCSLLNEQPMGFYPPDALVHEAQRRGIELRGPDVNRSAVECVVENGLAVRIGLGYVTGLREDDAKTVVAERERGRPYAGPAELASRSGVGREALGLLAWAGACEPLAVEQPANGNGDGRRSSLWRLGVAAGGRRVRGGDQLALPLAVPTPPPLRELGAWESVVADYEATGMTLGEHPMSMIRPSLGDGYRSSEELGVLVHGTRVRVAGMVVARQRPATARGVVFMLLEDELGTVNLIIPPPVYERHRLAVRTAPMVRVEGRLERRGPNMNVVADGVRHLERPELPLAEVRPIEPPSSRETGRPDPRREERRQAAARGAEMADLDAVLPAAHSFGRRGR
jgi:error-prone DNA polymerase